MKIVCESCGAKYSIADEKVAGKVFKIRCKKCSAVIVVKGEQPQEGTEETRVFDYGSDAIWHVVVNGEQQGPFAPRQIGELLAEGKIDWEAYVWREGMEGWQPAKDVQPLVAAVMAEAEGDETGAAPSGTGEVFGGSNDMGADPFASADDGGLSGVIGQSSASAAGGGADLFSDASRNAFAGAAEEEDDAPRPGSGSFGGPKVSEAQAMTGQRNENSVLFSLANLQALATGSGAAPSARPKAGMAQGEGSGLIDIRALASATQAMADKPNVSAREKVEDLLAVGSTGTTFSATSLAAPVAVEKHAASKPLLYAMAAAIGVLGLAVAFLVVRPQSAAPNAQITPTTDGQGAAATGASTATAVAPAAAPQAAEPTPSNAPAPVNEARDEEEKSTAKHEHEHHHEDRSSGSHSEHSSRHHGSDAPSAKSESAPVAQAADEPAPPKRSSSGDKSIDDLLDTALGGKPKAAAAAPKAAASENLPSTPSRDDVLSAMKSITSRVQACGGGQSGVAMAKVSVAGATGKVSGVDVGGQFAGTPVAGCIAKEVAKAKLPRFQQNTFSFSYPFKI